jgi:hypothetical protein
MAINARHRDKSGEISRKHGNTLIRTLRKTYGQAFATGCADDETLNDVLHKLDEPSLNHLVRDHHSGKLEQTARASEAATGGDKPWSDPAKPDDPDDYMREADEGAYPREPQRYSIEVPASTGDVEKS